MTGVQTCALPIFPPLALGLFAEFVFERLERRGVASHQGLLPYRESHGIQGSIAGRLLLSIVDSGDQDDGALAHEETQGIMVVQNGRRPYQGFKGSLFS